MKEFLKKIIDAKEKRAQELRDQIKKSEDVGEVRSLGETLQAVLDELNDAKKQLEEIDKDGGAGGGAPADNGRSFVPSATYAQTPPATARSVEPDALSTMEYRKAFKDFVQAGTHSDLLKRAAAEQVSADLGILLPNTIVQRIITGVQKVYGQLYSRVTKTNVKGGVQYPIGAFSATFVWGGTAGTDKEHGVSEKQKAGAVDNYITFTYHIGEARIAQSLLQTVVTVEAFEDEIVKALVDSYVKAMDVAIESGTGVNQPTGILTEAKKSSGSRIPKENIIEFTAAEMADWKSWQKKLFAKIPLSMRSLRPEFVMTADTWESNIMTLTDDTNKPVHRETYNPETGDTICKFRGREVCLVEEGGFKSFDTAATGDFFGMMWVPEKAYAINSNMQFGYKKYFDEDTNQWITKGLVIVDGQVLDGAHIFLFKKKVASGT